MTITTPGCLFTDEQRDLVPVGGEIISKFGPEASGGEISEPPDPIERLVGGTGGHDAFHVEIMTSAQAGCHGE